MESLRWKICIFMQDQSIPTFLDINEFLNRQSTRPILAGTVTSHLKNGGEHGSGLHKTNHIQQWMGIHLVFR